MKHYLFRNKYCIKSTRLPGWDYSWPGWYFVTICVKDFKCLLGKIIDGQICLSNVGRITANEWERTGHIRKNVKLDEWIIMPNHLHGIILFKPVKACFGVETHCNASLQRKNAINRFGPQSNNVPAIIRGFKGAVKNKIKSLGCFQFSWQQRYYDHIIRNEKSLYQIRQYIENNPLKWDLDKLNPQNLKNL